MKRVLLSFFAAVLLAAPAAAQPPMGDMDYFPLKKGTTWTYNAGGMTVTVRVVGEDMIGKNMCARLETSLNGMVLNDEHVTVLQDGVYRCATGRQEVKPPLLILKLPPKKGVEWSVNSASAGEKVTGKFVSGEEEIPVTYEKAEKDKKDKKVKKVKVVTVTGRDILVNGQRVTLTSSYAPGVGMVKQVGSVAGVTKTLELTAFMPPKE